MTSQLRVAMDGAHRVSVSRNAAVPGVLWSKVIGEWGTAGDPDRAIVVSLETFLANLDWLPSYCRRFQTGIDWDEAAREHVVQSRQERDALAQLMRDLVPLEVSEVRQRLAGTRFERDLRSFQLRDLGKLLALPNGANFSVPGAGKTTTTYALYEAERAADRVDRLLVVAPLSAFEAWSTEALECFDVAPIVHRLDGQDVPPDAEVCLVTYQRLAMGYGGVARWAQTGRCHVVLDEAHRMKRGWAGRWGQASLSLAYLAARRDVLTGTPAPQSLRDLDAILDFAWPGQARRILPPAIFQANPPPALAAQTGDTIRPLFVRTTKSDLKLREPDFRVLEIPLEGLQREIYDALRNNYAGTISLSRNDRTSLTRMGRVAMYLLEAATNPGLLPVSGRPDPITGRPRFPLADVPTDASLLNLIARYIEFENPPKFSALTRIVRDNAAAGRKSLVWTNFVSNIEQLAADFAPWEPAIVHGGVPSMVTQANAARTRESEIDRFRNDARCAVLLANPAATSEGVSLHHDCHDAIYLDRTFNAGHYLQSIDRIHRLGMPETTETRITLLVTAGTIDVTVTNQVEAKARRLGAILRDEDIATMALPDDEDYRAVISEDDLAVLYAHLQDRDATAPQELGA